MRRLLRIARMMTIVAIAGVVIMFFVSIFWTGGIHGSSGDLLLGVYPGQLRLGWSQDWSHPGNWATWSVHRSTEPMQLGPQGGNTFTAAPPYEVAVDLPLLLILVPLIYALGFCVLLIRSLPAPRVAAQHDGSSANAERATGPPTTPINAASSAPSPSGRGPG